MEFNVEEIRRNEYPALEQVTYLDFAGGALCAKSVIEKHAALVQQTILVNPHTFSGTQNQVDLIRQRVLQLFQADPSEYDLVFVSNTTAGVKLIGECMVENDHYTYLTDSHTSLAGLRSLCNTYTAVTDIPGIPPILEADAFHVVSWPAQSNFNGKRYPVQEWLASLDEQCISVIDAASYCGTSILDLSNCHPDLMVFSFYKMFGYPDIAGLIVRKSAKVAKFLGRKRYFGGGTIEALATQTNYNPRKKDIHSALEEGTLPIHSIMSIGLALDEYQRLYKDFSNISRHSNDLAQALYIRLHDLTHSTGRPMCELYFDGADGDQRQGPIVTFNLIDEKGDYIGYSDVVSVLNAESIILRGGTMCNSGAASLAMGISDDRIIANHKRGHICGDAMDIIDGHLTGAVRASFGPCSSIKDVDRLVQVLTKYYLSTPTALSTNQIYASPQIHSLTIFPIKSCAGFTVSEQWPVFPHGLEFDRQFALVEKATGKVMTLKKFPKMAHVRPRVDRSERLLTVEAFGNSIVLSIEAPLPSPHGSPVLGCSGQPVYNCLRYDSEEASRFFSQALGIECYLVRSSIDTAMVNSSPLLIVSKTSARHLAYNAGCDIDYRVFRANIVLEGTEPFIEDSAHAITIGDCTLELLEQCRRCNMVCIDPDTGKHNNEPYLALHKLRKWDGRIYFGRYARILHASTLNS